MMRETRRAWACALLSAALLAGWLVPPAPAQERRRKPVVVSFGQPSIWSLEQAHYLLARMHQENLELRARSLAALDPNETHATRIELLKQLLEVGAQFDDRVRFKNERIVRNAEFNDRRRIQLIEERDGLRSEARRARLDINRLQLDRERMNTDGSTEAEISRKDAELSRRRADLTAIEGDIKTHDTDIAALDQQTPRDPADLEAPTPTASPLNSRLPSSLVDSDDVKRALESEKGDPRLNATTKLDNHVHMQYEIIAKQLTLLRDEVGPGERLVFLELPQSVYTTPGPGDEKMAQAWWHVNGYTRTDPLLRLLLELYEVERRWMKIYNDVPAFRNSFKPATDGTACGVYADTVRERKEKEKAERERLAAAAQGRALKDAKPGDPLSRDLVLKETFYEFQCEYENARARLIGDLYREARSDFARAQQGGARDTSELVQAIRDAVGVGTVGSNEKRDEQRGEDAEDEVTRRVEISEKDWTAEEKTLRKSGRGAADVAARRRGDLTEALLCILSDPKNNLGDPSNCLGQQRSYLAPLFAGRGGLEFKKGIEYVRMDDRADRADNGAFERPGQIELRTVRTVDIIPRQSALNVNDIQSTVKATGILAAFKFLFGFAGQVNFQRQREQFEQFIHQELYASGFGKGDRDFGWTFGALPGTKRVAPGVRTTYAVLVVPDDAESLVLSARGCYFPRKSYSPLDFEDTAHKDWDREGRFRSYNCGDEQTYIIPIPNGGDRSNFWVTNVDYITAADGHRATVSIRGKNFSTQMGVLVNGAPLWPAVGLAQPLLARRGRTDGNANANDPDRNNLSLPLQPDCDAKQNAAQGAPKVCGSYERIDPEQIVISFTVSDNFKGTPTITLVAPGKAVDINYLPNLTVNGVRNTQLSDSDFVFGARPDIKDLQVFQINPGSDSKLVYALLTGKGFGSGDEVYVNGRPLADRPAAPAAPPAEYKEFKSAKLYRLIFEMPPGEKVSVTLQPADSAPVTKEFINPLHKKEEKPPGN